jgi:hypothetical protein
MEWMSWVSFGFETLIEFFLKNGLLTSISYLIYIILQFISYNMTDCNEIQALII